MIKLATVENVTCGNCTEEHVLAIHACCPVSKNPMLGSTLTIAYAPCGRSLEVGRLYAYIHSFRGGLHGPDGELLVRDIEGMISRVADDCAKTLGQEVKVTAHLLLLPHQEMNITCIRNMERECDEPHNINRPRRDGGTGPALLLPVRWDAHLLPGR